MIDLTDKTLLASVSGGKDSTAMMLHFIEAELPFMPVFLDTGWEHPETYRYLDHLEKRFGNAIVRRKASFTMTDLIRKKGMFPSGTKQFCTEELKVAPMAEYVGQLQDRGAECVNAVGVRAQESKRRAAQPTIEWSEKLDCQVWRPIHDWTIEKVIEIHRRHDLQPNSLYLQGASRVGCWPCIHSRKSDIRLVAETDPERIDLIEALEAELSVRRQAPRSFFRSARRIPGPSPVVSIRRMVEWSRTKYGGKEAEEWDPDGFASTGCAAWGFCDANPQSDPEE